MNSLNYFDIIIMILFTVVSFSIYKMLKPENILFSNEKKVNSGKIIKVFKDKKALRGFVLETLKNESLDLKVQKLSKIDKTFEPQTFMSWAKDSFEYIFKNMYLENNPYIKCEFIEGQYKLEKFQTFDTHFADWDDQKKNKFKISVLKLNERKKKIEKEKKNS